MGESWEEDYAKSEYWGQKWRDTHSESSDWPEGVRLQVGRMIQEGLVCVPETRVEQVIRELHVAMNHASAKKVAHELSRRYLFPPSFNLLDLAKSDRRKCLTCQACDPPTWSSDAPLEFTPVPAHIMSSVSLDIFTLPTTEWEGHTYNSLLVCVDRLSGWIIARPCMYQGPKAEYCAHLQLRG